VRLVCDAEAISALFEPDHPGRRRVRQALEAARRVGRDVAVATVTLAELYRGAARSQALDSWLARQSPDGVLLRDTDRQLARVVGALLSEAGLGSAHLADAHAVAVAVEDGGGVVLTADPTDLARLAAPYRTVLIEEVSARRGRSR
jgi:predicted nucleic acid-binding protein